MRIYTFAVQKGGAGKTTSAAAIASAAAKTGRKVLAIDLDPQGNLSYTLRADTSRPGSYEFMAGTPFEDIVQHIDIFPLDIVPASWNLSTMESGAGAARKLQRAIEPIKGNYDIIIIDTPPTAGILQYNALQASDGLIIPLSAGDIYSIQSLYQITDTAKAIRETNPALQISGVLLTRYSDRSTINRQLLDIVKGKAEELDAPFWGTIPQTVAVQEAAAMQEPLTEYGKNKAGEQYAQIFAEYIAPELD